MLPPRAAAELVEMAVEVIEPLSGLVMGLSEPIVPTIGPPPAPYGGGAPPGSKMELLEFLTGGRAALALVGSRDTVRLEL